MYDEDDEYFDDMDEALFGEGLIDGVGFADPGGRSALRAATPENPRIHPCPDCGAENALTTIDVNRGYCCNRCADKNEMSSYY